MEKIVILDTNFLLIPYQFKVDIFTEIARICDFGFKMAVLDRTIEELEKIKNTQKGRNRLAAMLALELLKKKDLKIIRTNSKKPVDDLIAEQAEKGAIVATQDAELRKIIKNSNGKTIFLRNRRFLKIG